MTTILDQIVATKWREIADCQRTRPLSVLEATLDIATKPRGFESKLAIGTGLSIIAEVKKASPSAGIIRADFDPLAIAKTYARHGAAAISVLTDRDYFQGDLAYLTAIRAHGELPLLRKDFIVDRYQLLEARHAGADAVLLIAEILPGERMLELFQEATQLGLDVLVELHDAEQLSRVLDFGVTLLGINNRDLRSFVTRLEHTLDLVDKIPEHITVVSESGIRSYADMQRLQAAGVDAVLVGESLMRAPDIGLALDELRGL